MSDIFVSYKKEDRPIVERFVTALKAAGKDVWWDNALTPNEAWDAMIERQIAAARVVIVLWSPRSIHSDWVRSEAHYAQDHHKIVPVMIEGCSIPLAFMLRQAVDLTDGKFGPGNPNWTKLLEWIDAVESGDVDAIPDVASPATAAAAAVPIKAATGERWLGPAARPRLLATLVGVLLLGALAFFFFRGSLGFAQGAHPDVYVDPIAVTKSADIPADFSSAVKDEITTQLNAASRITPLEGDGKRHNDAYQMSGNVRHANGNLTMFAKIFAPGIAAPVLSPRIEVPEGGQAVAAKYLGSNAAGLLRCIATASDSSGSEILILPEKAIRPWAQYCQYWILGGADISTVIGQLELVVKAAPEFANGWAALSEYRSLEVENEASAGPFREAYRKALSIDPENPKAMMLKALDIVGLQTVEPLRNFAEFEQLATTANKARASDCGCEAKLYRDVLILTGRFTDSLPYINRIIANDPGAKFTMQIKAYVLDGLGRTSEARPTVDELTQEWPGSREAYAAAFGHALATRDWTSAKALAPKLRAFPGHAQAPALIDAIQTGNRGAMDAAVAPMVAGLGQVDSVTPAMLALIAASGQDKALADGFAKAAQKYGAWGFLLAWSPDLKAMRARPEFIALVKKFNLPGYWRQAGHRPDICEDGNDEPVCKLI